MICTDVAARGLDIPAVDYIVQLDPPDDVSLDEEIFNQVNTNESHNSPETTFTVSDVPLVVLLARSAAV